MLSHAVVVLPPSFDDTLRLLQRCEISPFNSSAFWSKRTKTAQGADTDARPGGSVTSAKAISAP
jgi:hypothetical protein